MFKNKALKVTLQWDNKIALQIDHGLEQNSVALEKIKSIS